MNNIHAVTIYNENGKAIVGSPLRQAREAKVKQLQEIMQITKQHQVDTEKALHSERANHFLACELEITRRGSTGEATASNTNSFVVKLVCKEKRTEYYTNLIFAIKQTGARSQCMLLEIGQANPMERQIEKNIA